MIVVVAMVVVGAQQASARGLAKGSSFTYS